MKDFTNQMRDSQFAISASDKDNLNKGIVIERFSDKPGEFVQKPLVGIDWKRFPKELAPSSVTGTKKAKRKVGNAAKPNLVSKKSKVHTVHPDDILNKLEQAEKNGTKEGEDENEDNKNEDNLDSDEIDEELDEGTDYANNFFDNGENYLDNKNEDNLDSDEIDEELDE